ILTDPAETLYIFDEGHHLPDKARDHFAHASRLRGTDRALEQSIRLLANAAGELGAAGGVDRQLELMPGIIHELRQLLVAVRGGVEGLIDVGGEDFLPHHRFEHGLVPPEIREWAGSLQVGFQELGERLGRVAAVLEEAMDDGGHGIDLSVAEKWYPALSVLR